LNPLLPYYAKSILIIFSQRQWLADNINESDVSRRSCKTKVSGGSGVLSDNALRQNEVVLQQESRWLGQMVNLTNSTRPKLRSKSRPPGSSLHDSKLIGILLSAKDNCSMTLATLATLLLPKQSLRAHMSFLPTCVHTLGFSVS
jgi:hypothetical protein